MNLNLKQKNFYYLTKNSNHLVILNNKNLKNKKIKNVNFTVGIKAGLNNVPLYYFKNGYKTDIVLRRNDLITNFSKKNKINKFLVTKFNVFKLKHYYSTLYQTSAKKTLYLKVLKNKKQYRQLMGTNATQTTLCKPFLQSNVNLYAKILYLSIHRQHKYRSGVLVKYTKKRDFIFHTDDNFSTFVPNTYFSKNLFGFYRNKVFQGKKVYSYVKYFTQYLYTYFLLLKNGKWAENLSQYFFLLYFFQFKLYASLKKFKKLFLTVKPFFFHVFDLYRLLENKAKGLKSIFYRSLVFLFLSSNQTNNYIEYDEKSVFSVKHLNFNFIFWKSFLNTNPFFTDGLFPENSSTFFLHRRVKKGEYTKEFYRNFRLFLKKYVPRKQKKWNKKKRTKRTLYKHKNFKFKINKGKRHKRQIRKRKNFRKKSKF